jgi:pyruvate/2-oxoglutarate dehydrogenase complex dihydrolipoamide dehydrogenase (E3) component
MPDYDVIVLGGGSAGTSAARAATLAGARTAMVNDGELGGLCILRGCMPTKAMLASAHAAWEAAHTEPFGVRVEGRVTPDFARIMARKDALVARFQRAKISSIEQQGYEVIDGRAAFAPGGGVEVNGRRLTASRYVIATGSRPSIPEIPGIEDVAVLTSDDVMKLASPPSSLIVYGAGVIGLEMSQFFARIGTDVLLVCRSPVMHHLDLECGAELTRALMAEPRLEHAIPATITGLRRQGNRIAATLTEGARERVERAEAVLMATGRTAAVDDLGLANVGLDPVDGAIPCDDSMRTAHPDVYVAGDATGTYQILHLANREGQVAGHNAAVGRAEKKIDYRLKMTVIFTDPPLAHVGMTEPEIAASGREIEIGRARFPETGRAITMAVEHGLWKLFVDRTTCEILGSSIVGPRADDLIHLVSTLMHYRGGPEDIGEMPWYHPTLSEVMINLERDLAGKMPGCEAVPPPPA